MNMRQETVVSDPSAYTGQILTNDLLVLGPIQMKRWVDAIDLSSNKEEEINSFLREKQRQLATVQSHSYNDVLITTILYRDVLGKKPMSVNIKNEHIIPFSTTATT